MRSSSVILLLSCAVLSWGQNPEFKNPPELSKPNGYNHVVIVNKGKLVLVSGEVGINGKGEIAGKDDFSAQTKQAFTNLQTALTAAGATTRNLVKLNYYVVGLNHEKLLALRTVRDSFIDQDHPPANTLVGVQALFREDAQIEIEAEAVIP
jgi:2-iminobutanoate/2-iminopropanoate deaminase